jgi:hypothetical protein
VKACSPRILYFRKYSAKYSWLGIYVDYLRCESDRDGPKQLQNLKGKPRYCSDISFGKLFANAQDTETEELKEDIGHAIMS